MPAHTPHPPEIRARACELYATVGPTEAARQTGVPKSTIVSWANRTNLTSSALTCHTEAIEASKAYQDALRQKLRSLLLVRAVEMLERIDEKHTVYRGKDAVEVFLDKAPAGDCKNYAVTAAILLDKYRLECGEVTSRQAFEGLDPRESALRHLDELQERRDRAA